MKWWLKLYTLPFVVSFLKAFGLCFVADVSLSNLLGSSSLGILSYSYLIYYFGQSFKRNPFRTNLNFHKISIPLPELKKAFYSHLFLSFFSIVISTLVGIKFSRMLGGGFSQLGEVTWAMTLAYISIGTIVFIWLRGQDIHDYNKYAFYDQQVAWWKKLLRSLTLFLMLIGFLVFLDFFGFDSEFSIYLFLFGILAGHCLFFSRALFHQTQIRADLYILFKYVGGGTIAIVSLFLCLAFLGRRDHLDQMLHPEERLSSFLMWQPLTGELKAETFLALEPSSFSKIDSEKIYHYISKEDLNSIPVSHFYDKKNPYRLYQYLKSGKVDHENLTSILDHMDQQHEFWKSPKKTQHFKQMVFRSWPDKVPFPTRHLAARQQWIELKKSTREIASESEQE